MAHWVRAKHLLSLGHHSEAALAFAESLRCEREKSDATGRGEAIAASSPGSLLAATAYAAFAALRTQAASTDAETREEAQMYIDQLRETFRRN
jgi:hypothetical protein